MPDGPATWTALGFVLCAAVLLVAGWALTRRDGRQREPAEQPPTVADEVIRQLDEDEEEGPRRRDD